MARSKRVKDLLTEPEARMLADRVLGMSTAGPTYRYRRRSPPFW